MQWYIQYWEDTETVLGSSGVFKADGRWSRERVEALARHKPPKYATHFTVYKSERLSRNDNVAGRIKL